MRKFVSTPRTASFAFILAVAFALTAVVPAQDAPLGRVKARQKPRSKPVPVSASEVEPAPTRALRAVADRSLQSVPPDQSPLPSASFLALGDNGTTAPPDTSGAVGPTHVVVALASELRYQSRTGDSIFRTNMDLFWGGLATTAYDPRVVYDPYGGRFIMSAIGDPDGTNPKILIAASKTSDPEDGWHRFSERTDLVNPVFPDSPTLGFNKNWVVVQANMYNKTTFGFFRSEVFVYTKSSLYAGTESFRRLSFPPEFGDSQVPAVTMDSAHNLLYMIQNWNGYVTNEFGDTFGYLRIFNIAGAIGAERIVLTDALDRPVFAKKAGGPWDTIAPNDQDFLPQLGSTNKIYAGDARIQSLMFRDGLLFAAHTVFYPALTPNRAAVQWWATTPTGVIIQNGDIDDPTGLVHYAYPSIGVNSDLDVLVGYTRFSASQYPSANYSFRAGSDAFDFLRNDVVLKAGDAPYYVPIAGLNRWGDWSATVVDPVNDTDLWTLQEYAAPVVSGIDRWGTWWGRVAPPNDLGLTMTDAPDPVTASQNITYSLQVTNKQDQRVSGARVTITLPPGTAYSSATSSKGSCSHLNGVVTCLLGQILPLTNETISVTVTANLAGFATNTAVLTANGPDINGADNTAIAITDVRPAADLSVQGFDSPDPVTIGSNVTYSVIVSNRGPSSASGVSLVNTLPVSFSLASVSASQGFWTTNSGVLTFTVGSITPGSIATFTIVGSRSVSGLMTNRAQVSASTTDLNGFNNSASVATLVNARPTISAIATQTWNEDTTRNVQFTVSDAETPGANLQVAVSSSNQGVIPNSGLSVIPGTGGNRTLSINPALNQNGNNITISVTVTDGSGAATTSNFVANVTAVNDPPTISNIQDTSCDEDTSTGFIAFNVSDPESSAGSLTPSVTSTDQTVVPLSGISFAGSGGSRTIRITPATNQFGTSTITVSISDGSLSASDQFTLTVNSINDFPVITAIPNQGTDEDTPTAQIFFTVSDVENPATNLITVATSSNQSLVPDANLSIPGTNSTRSLVATPALNQSGTTVITVTVTDRRNDSTSTFFTLTVTNVNDPPKLNSIANVNTNEDVGPIVVNLTGIGSGAANEAQTLQVTASTDRPDIIRNLSVNHDGTSPTGALNFETVPDAFGTAGVTVTVDDGGPTNRFFSQQFSVILTGINDPPTLDPIGKRTINEDAGEQTVPLTGISTGPTNEIGQVITNLVSATPPNLITGLAFNYVAGASNGTLRFTPVANASGTATVSVVLGDGRPQNPTIMQQFQVEILPINDPPTIFSMSDRRINEDTVLSNALFHITDIESGGGALTPEGSSSDTTLVPNGNISFGGSGTNRSVTITPASNRYGVTTITIRITDPQAGSTSTNFQLTVDPVNDPPTLAGLPTSPVALNEDSPQQIINLSNLTPGGINETGQVLTVRAASSNETVIAQPIVDYVVPNTTAVLLYTPAANATGMVTLAAIVRDSEGAETMQTFQVNLLPINDPPTITEFTDQEISEDTPLVDLPFVIDDLETTAGVLELAGSSSNPELVAESGITFGGTGRNRTLTVRPITNEFGSTFISVTVTDSNGESASAGFILTVNDVNDRPSITQISSPQNILEDTPTGTLLFRVQDPETPEHLLTVTKASSDPAVIPVGNIALGVSGTNRTVVVTPAADQSGLVTVTLTVSDGSLTNATAFQVNVTGVNDPPTLAPLSNMNLAKNSGLQVVPLTGISTGAANETNQTVVISATSSVPGLVPHPQVVYTSPNPTGTLRFTPAANATGTVTITVIADDQRPQNPTVTNTFTVTISDGGPSLRIVRSASTNVVISWPATGTYTLQVNSNMPPVWIDSGLAPTLNGTNYNVTQPATSPRRYYRLRN